MNAVTPVLGAVLTNHEKWLPEDLSTMIKAGLEHLSGYARYRKNWVKVSSELAQDRRVWGDSIQYVVNSICDDGSTRSR